MMTLYVSELTEEYIDRAVIAAQTWLSQEEDKHYRAEDLKPLFIFWLESSIEQLAEEAMYHLFEGGRVFTFNREAFRDRLHKLQATEVTPTPLPDVTLAA
jgi:hypothetical protein